MPILGQSIQRDKGRIAGGMGRMARFLLSRVHAAMTIGSSDAASRRGYSGPTVVPIIRFIGRSGSGKTTLLSEVIRLLRQRDIRLAVFKHAHHRVDLDRAGKDSFRFAEAGAAVVSVLSPEKLASFQAVGRDEPSLHDLAKNVRQEVDLVLAEGFHGVATPYFLLLAPGEARYRPSEDGELLGVICAGSGIEDADVFHRDDPAAIADCIVQWYESLDRRELELERALADAQAFHGHMCAGQVLGVRLALLGVRSIGIAEPKRSKSLIAWVEVDRCGADAVQTVTGCKPGKRTLKLVDYGKLAATFLNTETGEAVRVVARSDSRERAAQLYPDLPKYDAQLKTYRTLPDEQLFDVQRVRVDLGEYDRPGKPLLRVTCVVCGEEVNDARHIDGDDGPLCKACAGGAYYQRLDQEQEVRSPW